ncbi:DgyrCDS510 [Dimorphilus gyrociliatus]|uniref:Ubiquinone biosynthesis O-methyltransferase, mitochondrial n=1 Tax=Dimorphilus gyrociliatus TaxID=2664684 RepID=A0A7I8V6D3_9ANNE|nr:DgyrCDS510 [Dimorphilus gyrociliatus]
MNRLCIRKRFGLNILNSVKLCMSTNSTTINEEEISKFDELSKDWWSRDGPLKALHSMNALRIPMIRDKLISNGEYKTTSKPLESLKIMDIGCGGGILTEPLSRLGATVTGIDASTGNIEVAKIHLKLNPALDIEYLACPVESLVEKRKETYDALVASEVVEHVNDLPIFIKACCQLVKPGGQAFFTTINRTLLSHALAIVAGEYIFRLVPPGTHQWDMFVPPSDLKDLLEQNDMSVKMIQGMTLNPLSNTWSWIDCDQRVNLGWNTMSLISRIKPIVGLLSNANKRKALNLVAKRRMGDYAWRYRTVYVPPRWAEHLATGLGVVFWYWVMFHLYYDSGKLLGHYYPPDPSKWTDEELGIPSDDVE